MTPTKFMAEYFRDRTELILTEIERRSPHRQKYFTSDCRWDSRRGTVESSQAERILDVSEAGDEVLVVKPEGMELTGARAQGRSMAMGELACGASICSLATLGLRDPTVQNPSRPPGLARDCGCPRRRAAF
jgi:hypothetical protein